MADVKSSMNLGSTGSTSKSSRLVADLKDNYVKLDQVLAGIEKKSKSIAENLKSAFPGGMGGGSGPGAGSSMNFVDGGTVPVGGRSNSGFVQQATGGKFDWKGAAGTMAAAAFSGASKLVVPGDYITNDIAKNRYSFFNSGAPGTNSSAFTGMMNAGTPISNMDATNAIMAGSSMGFMPGLKNYSTISNSAAGISNLVPGVGLEAGMNATAALNQGSSVNKLRMIGIQVRDNNGFMRGVEDIAKDLWNTLNRNKTSGGGTRSGKITQEDLSYSLQPGMSLDMLLNQYFGSDAVLRQSVISYLYQFASQGTGAVTKDTLQASGAMPGISASMGAREAASYKFTDTYTDSGIQGIMSANGVITGAANFLSDSATALGKPAVTAATFLETMGGAGNGAGADIFGGFGKLIQGRSLSTALEKAGGAIASRALETSVGLAYVGITAAALSIINDAMTSVTADKLTPFQKVAFGVNVATQGSPKNGGFGTGVALSNSDLGIGSGSVVTMDPWNDKYGVTSGWHEHRTYKIGNRSITDIHDGVDYGAPGGTPINPVADGMVVANKWEPGGKGNYLVVAHRNGYQTIYGHMKDKSALPTGMHVSTDTVLGQVGKTGAATGNHLHLGVQDSHGKLYNPNDFLNNKLPAIGGGSGMGVATSDYTNNYGGVTVNINMPANAAINENTLAQEIKRVLTQDARIKEAVRA
jgi:murein DD-endopeptidase MepM/ murein hydrolase activator NlpD